MNVYVGLLARYVELSSVYGKFCSSSVPRLYWYIQSIAVVDDPPIQYLLKPKSFTNMYVSLRSRVSLVFAARMSYHSEGTLCRVSADLLINMY